ncbi:MFS transporter [Leifsonia aquatica]|uniref:MFS transporter n=1 Tax=Leifsonia aquatica TaxID=144185 RepID=UPI0004699F25|nr:MFS transporter [Leifsonia aquatica]
MPIHRTTPARAPAPAPAPSVAPAFRWPPVIAVALSTFTVVTAEMMPVGLLPSIAADLQVNPGLAGMSLTITGVMAAIVAPLTPLIAGRRDRRTLLAGFLALLVLANAASAVSGSFAMFAIARVLIGVSMGVVWASAGGLGPRLADPAHLGRAMTTIFSGVSIGMVLGLPAGTFIAGLAGWRAAFWAIAALSAAVALFALLAMPRLPVVERARLAGMFLPWRDRGVRTGFVITALVVMGHFMAYTYVRPVLETNPAITPALIVAALAAFGLTGIIGNLVVGPVTARRPRMALLLTLGAIALGIGLLPIAVAGIASVFVVLALWGAGYGGISVATQAWIRSADPAQVERSSAMWSGVFNGSIAVGAFAGGLVFDALGGATVLLVAAGIVAAGWITTLVGRPGGPGRSEAAAPPS